MGSDIGDWASALYARKMELVILSDQGFGLLY